MTRQEKIRNFCIIAHIDHGKSTLADRLIEQTETVALRDMEDRILDRMDLERERGITIKSQAVSMIHEKDGISYTFNLIDTPGHVDFTYEVSRALAACEGAILVIDASQGVEAQTLANVYLALDNDLEILPVINKIDLPSARPDEVAKEVEEVIGLDCSYAPRISAKEGVGIKEVLDAVVDYLPAPKGDEDALAKALIFDSFYDNYKGAISFVRMVDGCFQESDPILFMSNNKRYDITELGIFTPLLQPAEKLQAGEVGYLAASIKTVADTRVGDTVTNAENPTSEPLPGYKKVTPVVFCGIYPVDGANYDDLRDALDKLHLNDASLLYEPETSVALGFGFRCGFLGLLHMEIIQQRIEREFDLDIVTTAPSVSYHVVKTDGEMVIVENPSNLPDPSIIEYMEEPVASVSIMTPDEYIGAVMEICQEKRGTFGNMEYIEGTRVTIHYTIPLNEIIYDFFDLLKSKTRGYASMDYEIKGYERSDLVRLDILLNGEICDALSLIVHRERAYQRGRAIAEKLKDVIPRQMFEVPIQAAIGGKIIARETVKAMRKDVLAKCYGGDISRKKKLLEKQKEGKKRMRQVGSVEVPSEAFMSILKLD
ncbi:MAG: translation elongation factor 4 [Christensenellaceae bacterium]|jgi:GTP-binding protein LepA